MKKYLEFIRTLPCANCGDDIDIQAHHLIGIHGFGGMAMKAPNLFSMPLCLECHRDIHMNPDMLPLQERWILSSQYKAMDAGMQVTFNDPKIDIFKLLSFMKMEHENINWSLSSTLNNRNKSFFNGKKYLIHQLMEFMTDARSINWEEIPKILEDL